MGLGTKVKEIAIEHVKQKAARDILSGINDWRGSKIHTARRRWLFELIQNAVDTAKARGRNNLRIEIRTEDNSVRFCHDGGYFTFYEIGAIIYGGSTKPYAPESEYIGRFGTGFLVTHIVSRKVKIKGFAGENESLYEFEMEIDRESDDESSISENIEKCFSQLDGANLVSHGLNVITEFVYPVTDDFGKEAVKEGIKELKKNIPFILAFNEIIEEIVVDGETFKREVEEVSNSTFKVIVGNRAVYVKNDAANDLQVAILVDNGAMSDLKGYPKIFIGMPLVGTADYINIPFVVNSFSFDPTKERDALKDEKKNRDLINRAFEKYKQLLNEISEEIRSLFNAVDIQLIPKINVEQNPLWDFFNKKMMEHFRQILENIPLVNCLEGRRPVKEVIFPDKGELEDEFFDSFYRLICKIKRNVPYKDELNGWILTARKLSEIFPEHISLYDIESLRGDLERFVERFRKQRGRNPKFEDFAKGFYLKENAKKFLLEFFDLAEKLYKRRKIATDFIRNLLPNQMGAIGVLGLLSELRMRTILRIDNGIPEELKEILHKVGWKIKRELVDRSFARFEIVKDCVHHNELDTDGALKELIVKQGIRENKLREQWDDSIFGWIELFRWCARNEKLQKGFPIITKGNRIKKIENLNKEEILLPFKLMDFDEKYEEIYPEDRIIHPKYFETGDKNELISKLKRYNAFITNLPIYKRSLKLDYDKLKSIVVDGVEISKGDHIIETENRISLLPFWNEIIGRASSRRERGRLLFEFVSAVVNRDESWEKEIEVKCSCRKGMHKIIPCIWLANLKTDSWVPVETSEGKIVRREATKENIEKLFSPNELRGLIRRNPDKICSLLSHFGFDELDLKIKLQSIKEGKPEEVIRKEVSTLVEITSEILGLIREDPNGFKEAIYKFREKQEKEHIRTENKKIGENLERVIKKIIEDQGLRANPVHKGGDLEIWPVAQDGWDGGQIEINPYLLEVKFTSGNRIYLSKTQSDVARIWRENYIILVVENVSNLRDRLKEIDEEISEEIIQLVVENSYIIEQVHTKFVRIPNPDEVEPDVQGYWIKRRLWSGGNNILRWLKETFD